MKGDNDEKKKNQRGITLIALIITVILLLILAGITISYSVGNRGIILNASIAKEKANISRIQETLELEKVNLVDENDFSITLDQYIQHITNKGIIKENDEDNKVIDAWNVDYGSCYIKVEGKYYFKIEDDEKHMGNLQITYVEKMLLVSMEETIEGTTVKVVVTPKEGTEEIKEYEYYIKQKGETKVKKETNQTGEYTFTGLKPEQSYWIEVKVIGKNGEEVRLGKWITIGKDEGAPTASITITGETQQASLPVKLQATVKQEDEISGINIDACGYVLNQSSEEIGINEEDYIGRFTSEEEIINLELTAIGEWYLHVLTVDNENNKAKTTYGPIKVKNEYHVHKDISGQNQLGNYQASSSGGCFTKVEHTYQTITARCTGTYTILRTEDGNHPGSKGFYNCNTYCGWYGHQGERCENSSRPQQVVTGTYYALSCGKTEQTVEEYMVTY